MPELRFAPAVASPSQFSDRCLRLRELPPSMSQVRGKACGHNRPYGWGIAVFRGAKPQGKIGTPEQAENWKNQKRETTALRNVVPFDESSRFPCLLPLSRGEAKNLSFPYLAPVSCPGPFSWASQKSSSPKTEPRPFLPGIRSSISRCPSIRFRPFFLGAGDRFSSATVRSARRSAGNGIRPNFGTAPARMLNRSSLVAFNYFNLCTGSNASYCAPSLL